MIDICPEEIQVRESKVWKDKDVSQIELLKTIHKSSDWAFSTPYKGRIERLSLSGPRINKEEVQIE